MRTAIALITLPLLSACVAPEGTSQIPANTAPVEVRLPGRMIQTDGSGDIVLISGGSATCAPLTPAENAVALAATNSVRANRGLPPLAAQAQLQRVANAHACEMAQRGTMTHRGTKSSGPGARLRAHGYNSRVAAENIAAGRMSLQQVLAEWSGSGGHVANITRPDVSDFALGRGIGADGRTTFWAAVYAGR